MGETGELVVLNHLYRSSFGSLLGAAPLARSGRLHAELIKILKQPEVRERTYTLFNWIAPVRERFGASGT